MFEAVEVLRAKMSKKREAEMDWTLSWLERRLFGNHMESAGHPTLLGQEEEALIINTLGVVAQWGFPLQTRYKKCSQKYFDKQGKQVRIVMKTVLGLS